MLSSSFSVQSSALPTDRRSLVGGALIAAVVLGLRAAYNTLSLDDLLWLLRPTAGCIALLTGATGEVRADGIAFPQLGVLLDKSCAGGHFALVLAGFAVFLLRSHIRSLPKAVFIITTSIVAALPATVIGNVSRVLLSIAAVRMDPTHSIGGTDTMHLFIGALVQVLLLLLTHALLSGSFRSIVQRPA
jgi:exosortase K